MTYFDRDDDPSDPRDELPEMLVDARGTAQAAAELLHNYALRLSDFDRLGAERIVALEKAFDAAAEFADEYHYDVR
jgi:hypothetical protein